MVLVHSGHQRDQVGIMECTDTATVVEISTEKNIKQD